MSSPEWIAQTLDSAADLDDTPPELSPTECQRWCNFVVWAPGDRLPSGVTVGPSTVRREAPPGRVGDSTAGRTPWSENNPSAYRFELSTRTYRVRVKEFLYDWAFPALGHACLWGSPTRPVVLDAGRVVWHGIDYKKNHAASARFERTMIEVSVLDGTASDDDLCAIVAAFEPVDLDAEARIGATPFARLSYWARHGDATMLHVPVGLWVMRRTGRDHEGEWTAEPSLLRSRLQDWGLPSAVAGLHADSIGLFGRDDEHRECEVIYSGGPGRNDEIRLLVQRSGHGRLVVPSEREDHPGEFGSASIGGVPVQVAWIDAQIGPWDAVWNGAGLDVKLTTTASTGFDRAWLVSAVNEIQDAVASRSC